MLLASLLGACALTARTAFAFNFIIDSKTAINECGSVQFNWTAGTPPYKITAIGVFDEPQDLNVPDSAVSSYGGAIAWDNFPFANSKRVVFVMSDASGFGTGGVSKLYNVGPRPSGVAACSTTTGEVPWTFAVNPMVSETITDLKQCSTLSFSWSGSNNGQVDIIGVIPGGNAFSTGPQTGRGVSIPLGVQQGSQIVFVGYDTSGQTGGTSSVYTVTPGDNNCNIVASTSATPSWTPTPTASASASSTAPPPTKTASKTQSAGSGGGGMVTITAITTVLPHGSSGISPGAIAGIVVGVIGGVIILQALILWFCCRRQLKNFLDNRKVRKQRRASGGIDLYERHPGSGYDGLVDSGASMRATQSSASRGYDDDLGTTISPFIGGTPATDSPRYSAFSSSAGTPATGGWAALPSGAGTDSARDSQRHVTSYPPASQHTGQHSRSGSGGSSSQDPVQGASRLPMKMQLALANPDNQAVFNDGQPSPNTPVGGFRRHEDAGPLGPNHAAADGVEDLPPTYNPQWDSKGWP